MPKVQNDSLVNLIKEICKGVFDAQKPSTYFYGTVTSVSPLKVQLASNLILTDKFLKVPQSLTDYTLEVSMNWNTESTNIDHTHDVDYTDKYTSSGDIENKSSVTKRMNSNIIHSHNVFGTKEITIHNSLKIGDKVYLAMCQGGQDFIIIDKVVG